MVKGRLTILADNVVAGKVDSLGEHGFSAFIEIDQEHYLFDTGRGGTIVHNATAYGKNLGTVNKIIISHGHPDHTGGLPAVLRFHDQIDVLGHPDIFLNRFRKEKDGAQKYNGIPFARGHLEKLGAHFVFNKDFVEVGKGVYMSGEIPRETDFESGDMGSRYGIRDGKVHPEIVLDDQCLVIQTDRGILMLLGCAHSGVINTINHVIRKTETDKIWGIIGGTHLGFLGEDQLEKTIRSLRSYHIDHFIPAHCTGIAASIRLSREFEGIVHLSRVGMVFDF